MAGSLPNPTRDEFITAFRGKLAEKYGIVPFPHQAAWMLAADGLTLKDALAAPGEGFEVRVSDTETEWREVGVREGGRARVIADLGAFKIGKSFGAGLWTAAFACIPSARVQLVGAQYDICEPEFTYLVEFLCSDRGMGLKASSLQNRPQDGRMWLEFDNGARFEAKSWERNESLKGKEVDAMIFCEAYQLPGLECYTSFSQNLRVRNGFALFPTTPDRPWVKELHDKAHSGDPRFSAWHCTCGVHSSQNPYSFSREMMDRDRDLMTSEKFAIHYEGKLGDFVGRVYNFQRGEKQFTLLTHPFLFPDNALKIPNGWEVVSACDTGTFTSALVVAFSPDGDAFIISDHPNYDYKSGVIERDETSSIPSWCMEFKIALDGVGGRAFPWADPNSQFKREFQNYGIFLQGNKIPLESRTEVSREYFQHNRIWLSPSLKVLPFELENAAWPEEASAAGKFQRIKDRDHTLDCLEHILSRRPQGKWLSQEKPKGQWADQFKKKKPPQYI